MTEPNAASAPSWLGDGAPVVHSTFGTGVVGHVGEYNGTPTVWVNFDYGHRKALALEYGLPHLQPRGRWTRRTKADPTIRCDVCGARPVVLDINGQQFCEDHKSAFTSNT